MMIEMPWRRVYTEVHLCNDLVWREGRSPWSEFFEQKVKHLTCMYGRAHVSRMHYGPVWREWLALENEVSSITVTMKFDKEVSIRDYQLGGVVQMHVRKFFYSVTIAESEEMAEIGMLPNSVLQRVKDSIIF